MLTRGERFKDARLVHNQNGKQSMDEVAAATGLQKSMIAALEKDEEDGKPRSVGCEKVAILAKHYGVSLDWLLGLSEFRSIDINIQAISSQTGLNEENILNLIKWNSADENRAVDDATKPISAVVKKEWVLSAINGILRASLSSPRIISTYYKSMITRLEQWKESLNNKTESDMYSLEDDITKKLWDAGFIAVNVGDAAESACVRLGDLIARFAMDLAKQDIGLTDES